jgi:2-keto-4-pentenoate hydratase/2-oxohepta-3-ene-1,7-dioic acid hydratase in catechol pathway
MVDAVDPDGLGAIVRVDDRLEHTGAFVGFDWAAALSFAAERTELRPGDLLAGPGLGVVEVAAGSAVELEVESIGVLASSTTGEGGVGARDD